MALLQQIIPAQNYESIRDRIAEILADEISNQMITLQSKPELNAKVFLERFVPFDKVDMPCVNVLLSRGEYGNLDAKRNDGTYTYFIDCYTSSKTTDLQDADITATKKLHTILGVCRAILENNIYNTLGFAKPSISHTVVSDISIADPKNNQDATATMMGRLTFTVRVCESVQLATAPNIAQWNTSIKLYETDLGYYYSGQL